MTRSLRLLFLSPLLSTFACSSASDEPSEKPSGPTTTEDSTIASGGSYSDSTGGAAPTPGEDCVDDCPNSGAGGTTGGGSTPVFKPHAPGERVVGYLPTYRDLDPTTVPFETLTHLCVAFANTISETVDFDVSPEEINALVEAAHQNGVYVLASIAGAAGGQVVEDAIAPDNVDAYVAGLVDLVSRYQLDGIDVDIEGQHVTSTYEPFVKKLRDGLADDQLITAAVATWNGNDFPDGALAEFDFVNLMSYDHCGSWSAPCDHASYDESLSELTYWETTRGLGPGRVVLGVPFYGYCWGDACPAAALTYGEILSNYPDSANTDYLTGPGYEISFNRPETIAMKTVLSKNHGGIMVWELGQDAAGADSLMSVIAANQ